MKIKVIGKSHAKGISKKTNSAYDFITVHYNGRARFVEGFAAKTLTLDPKEYPYADVIVGGEYNVEFDGDGYLIEFLPVTKG